MDKVIRLLRFLSASLNIQAKLRINEHIRAALFGLSITAISYSLYRGWIDVSRATELYAIAVSIFGLAIAKTALGEPTSVGLTQAPTSPKPEPGTTNPLTTVAVVPIPEPTTPTTVEVPALKPDPLDRIK